MRPASSDATLRRSPLINAEKYVYNSQPHGSVLSNQKSSKVRDHVSPVHFSFSTSGNYHVSNNLFCVAAQAAKEGSIGYLDGLRIRESRGCDSSLTTVRKSIMVC